MSKSNEGPEGPTKLEDLGWMRVTDREVGEALNYLDLSDDEVRALPTKSVVLELGSGLNLKLAAHFKEVRPDVTFVALDPTLGFKVASETELSLGDDPRSGHINSTFIATPFYYDGQAELSHLSYAPSWMDKAASSNLLEEGVKLHRDRMENLPEVGALSAIVPNLPVADGSVDLILDSFGPGTWFCNHADGSAKYFAELERVLRAGGTAIVYPVDSRDEFFEFPPITERIEHVRERINRDLPGSLRAEFYEREDGSGVPRPGVHITKI